MTPVFLLSLPRSGSTLLQRLVSTHPDIATATEPWLLLPLVYALRVQGVIAEYNHQDMAQAIDDFLDGMPEGRAEYNRAVKRFAIQLYEAAAGKQRARYFLDKTPRYALISRELAEIFPEAHFIVLWRNPLAIAASMMNTWSDGKWNLHRFQIDLYEGLDRLCAFAENCVNPLINIRFEDFVQDPETQVARIGKFLNLSFTKECLRDFDNQRLPGRMGDKTGAKRYRFISAEPTILWPQAYCNPLRRFWARRYLDWVGSQRLEIMGYDKSELLEGVKVVRGNTRLLLSDCIRRLYRKIYPTDEQIARSR